MKSVTIVEYKQSREMEEKAKFGLIIVGFFTIQLGSGR